MRFSELLGRSKRRTPMKVWLTLSILCLACACRAPGPRPIARGGHLEFLEPQRVIKVEELAGGGHQVSFERAARYFAVDRDGSPDPGGLLAFAKKAVTSGKPVYATVRTGQKVVAAAPRPVRVRRGRRVRVVGRPAAKVVASRPTLLVRLAYTPDPRSK